MSSQLVLMLLAALIPVAASAQAYQIEAGQREVYRLEYSNTTISDLGKLLGSDSAANAPGLRHHIVTSVSGELERTAVKKQSSDWLFIYALRKPVIRLEVNGVNQAAAPIASDLAKPFVATVSTGGQIAAIAFDSAVSETSKAFARSILGATQFVTAGANGLQSWEVRETDPAGEYVAVYRRTDQRTYTRTRTTYLPQGAQAIEPRGQLTGVFDRKNGRLISLQGVDSQRVIIGGKTIASGVTNVDMRFVRTEKGSTVLPRVGESRALFAPELNERTIQRTELANTTADSLFAQLSVRDKSPGDTASVTPLYLKFKALVNLHPETSRELGDSLRTARGNGPAMQILSNALGTAGTPEAQDALIAAMKSRETEWLAMAALIPALGGVGRPTSNALSYMFTLAFSSRDANIASTATLAAGTMARNAGSSSHVRMLIDRLGASASPQEKSTLLLALGNTGSPLAISVVEKYIESSDQLVSDSAARALRVLRGASR